MMPMQSLSALQVVVNHQALQVNDQTLQGQKDMARLRKSIVFPRLMDIPSKDWGGEQHPQPWSAHERNTAEDPVEQTEIYYNTVGMAMYHRAFHTTPQEALEFLRQKCVSLDVPPPSHSWEDILQITSEQVNYDHGEHISEFRVLPITDHHRLFMALGLIPHDQKQMQVQDSTTTTWRNLLWNWPSLTPHKLFDLANAVAIPDSHPYSHPFCDEEEVECVLTLFDDEGGAQMLDTDTCLNDLLL